MSNKCTFIRNLELIWQESITTRRSYRSVHNDVFYKSNFKRWHALEVLKVLKSGFNTDLSLLSLFQAKRNKNPIGIFVRGKPSAALAWLKMSLN